jgi:prepilin-type N-terminal cleavage/methylation domain-containing protein
MHSRKFTLVELLIVIGIIAILAGILLPVVNGAAKRADMTKAKAEITTLINAIKQFESTYGVLPQPDGITKDNEEIKDDDFTQLILILQADDGTKTDPLLAPANVNKNSRKTRFLDIVGNQRGQFNDPWGQKYIVLIDYNYDGKIATIPPGVGVVTDGDPLYFSVVAYSHGPDGSSANAKAFRDNVYSFPVIWNKTNECYNITQ